MESNGSMFPGIWRGELRLGSLTSIPLGRTGSQGMEPNRPAILDEFLQARAAQDPFALFTLLSLPLSLAVAFVVVEDSRESAIPRATSTPTPSSEPQSPIDIIRPLLTLTLLLSSL